MAIPRVFISSTCYDLKYIRGNLEYFINNLGYEPVLSEDGDVFYNPHQHTHESCLSEVSTCQLFVLIIGGRHGGKYVHSEKSITNEEYNKAIENKIPVFTLVEQAVYAQHHVYTKNKTNEKIDARHIQYPSVDNLKIFEFIDEVKNKRDNNAIHTFVDFSNIEEYLKKQWAGLLFSHLSNKREDGKFTEKVSKIEYLSTEILKTKGDPVTSLLPSLYDIMLDFDCIRMLLASDHKPTPYDAIRCTKLEQCAKEIGVPLTIVNEDIFDWNSQGEISKETYSRLADEYQTMRTKLQDEIKKSGLTINKFKEHYGSLIDK